MFRFLDFDYMTDNEIDLIIDSKNPANEEMGYVPAYNYSIKEHGKDKVVGKIALRVGDNKNIFYGGHVGYAIDEEYRGNGYAFKACLLIKKLAKQHDMKQLVITCNPENIASRRTCEKAGGKLLEIIELSEDNDMYQRGERQKCRYVIIL